MTMNENVPYIWRVDYRNNMASPEKVLEIAHRKAREFLSRAATSAVAQGTLNSFVKAEHVLDGIHDGRIAVFVAIVVKLLLMLFDCLGFDDRVVALGISAGEKQPNFHGHLHWLCTFVRGGAPARTIRPRPQ